MASEKVVAFLICLGIVGLVWLVVHLDHRRHKEEMKVLDMDHEEWMRRLDELVADARKTPRDEWIDGKKLRYEAQEHESDNS